MDEDSTTEGIEEDIQFCHLTENDYKLIVEKNHITVYRPKNLLEDFILEEDDDILEADIPERIQLMEYLAGPLPTDDKSIEEESVWIYTHLSQDQLVKDINKEDIRHVLKMVHVHKLDIPFIAMYRKEFCRSLLDTIQNADGNTPMKWHKVLWAVHSLDKKWLLLLKRKTDLAMYFERYEKESRWRYDETRLALNKQLFSSIYEDLKEAKSVTEVDDVDAKFKLYFLSKIQIKTLFNLHFSNGEVDAALEISHEPIVRKHVRNIFMENATVFTSPTTYGNSTIDVYHQFSGIKWLSNQSLSKFTDAQWLLIQKAEQEKLIQVTIKLPESVQRKLLVDVRECYSRECVSQQEQAQLLNEQCKMISEDSFYSCILSLMEKEARSLLMARAKNWLLMEYGKQLWNKVSVAPYQRKGSVGIENEDEPNLRVMASCWGPGNPANTFVMLDSAGEIVDIINAGSIGIKSEGVVEQQCRKNDQERLLRFMTKHQPHVVCLGVANLSSCKQLKDDIYEVSQDMDIDILWSDESLPRLFENARVSADQLPGQTGIVKRAVALGRYLQNPLAMVATLCGPTQQILSWKLSPLDDFLTFDEKYNMVEQIMVDATNQIGIDVNIASSHEWLFAPLQFVAGLGPGTASSLQIDFVQAGSIFHREEIRMRKFITNKVYFNAAGFLRVRCSGAAAATSHIFDFLDDTRIHPNSYDLANTMAMGVYSKDVNDINADSLEMAIEQVREKPDILKALNFEEFAKSIDKDKQRYGTVKKETFEDIKNELLHGFKDWRRPFCKLNPDLLSGETDEFFFFDRGIV